jgi:V/A-type H+-transporting ATPase subunit D
MAKIKLTKNELKKQKDALKRFNRYLPTLQLKKKQLQMEIHKIGIQRRERRLQQEAIVSGLMAWVDVFGEELSLEKLIQADPVRVDTGNIAGINIPIFIGVDFKEVEYNLFRMPLWVDTALERIRAISRQDAELRVLDEQARLLGEEMRITTQRINLFEKVKIPEARFNIRRIQIYLGDQQTAAVVRGKIAKKKIEKVS